MEVNNTDNYNQLKSSPDMSEEERLPEKNTGVPLGTPLAVTVETPVEPLEAQETPDTRLWFVRYRLHGGR